MRRNPVDSLVWVERDELLPNDYNPNRQCADDSELLALSLIETGWTQPIVAFREGDTAIIVDGEHRWRCSARKDVQAALGTKVPVVFMTGSTMDRIAATVRHNRARGVHTVKGMLGVVELADANAAEPEEVIRRLGLDREEYRRLSGRIGRLEANRRGVTGFGKGWQPDG